MGQIAKRAVINAVGIVNGDLARNRDGERAGMGVDVVASDEIVNQCVF